MILAVLPLAEAGMFQGVLSFSLFVGEYQLLGLRRTRSRMPLASPLLVDTFSLLCQVEPSGKVAIIEG